MTTLWGRRRQIPELRARNYQVRTLGERLAVNTVIQGTAADIIKLAMIRCHDALAGERLETRLILTIHDELLFEGPPGEAERARALIEREMVGVWDREPAMAVDIGIGENWLRRSDAQLGDRAGRGGGVLMIDWESCGRCCRSPGSSWWCAGRARSRLVAEGQVAPRPGGLQPSAV